jgi:murein DD-endopeptidase MepM/ murein hydrolase activator NlpD
MGEQASPPPADTDRDMTAPKLTALFACTIVALSLVGAAAAAGDPNTAALQVTLRARGLYGGTIDGLTGPQTQSAVRAFQRRAGLPATGGLDTQTRSALGAYAQTPLGSRVMSEGMSGWDVSALQFLLAWHGFPSGTLNGSFGAKTEAALLRFQRWAALPAPGTAGPRTLAALRAPPPRSPLALAWPLQAPLGDGFGPRQARFHTGIDLPAPAGVPVVAGAAGRVVHAGWLAGGWGYTVTLAHRRGVRTMYTHLSRVTARVGDAVAAGETVGQVGASGDATGSHLHFEVRLRGAAVDPQTALPSAMARARRSDH